MSKFRTAKELGNSKQFFELIRSIGEAKSKQEEDKIITKETSVLKQKMAEKDVDKKQMKEYVVRLLYCEMLGHNAEFGYIHCVNLIASTDVLQKRTGYLAVQLMVSPEDSLLLLVVSPIQSDLKSKSTLEVCCALGAATKLVTPEITPMVIADIQKCLTHDSPLVRKKAIVCIHALWRRDENSVGDVNQYQQVLCDREPSVMACSLGFLQDLCFLNPEGNKRLVVSFVSILQQICQNRLPKEYDYHRIPAPWIQIKLLKLLAILCNNDVEKSKLAHPVITDVMKRAESGINIGNAVVFEAVKTITCLVPHPELIESAAEAIAKFLKSPNPNLKYLGITALSRIVLIDPVYAKVHRDVVMNCLEDHDETIKRKTLDLLYAMTNEDSVEAIVARLIKFLAAAHDMFLKADLVQNICNLAYRFYPNMIWYVNAMNETIKLGQQFVDNQTAQGLLKMIAEGSEDETEDENALTRTRVVDMYFELLDATDKLPPILVQIISWVLGEYGFMSKQNKQDDILDKLCDNLERSSDSTDTRGYIITAIMKITAQMPRVPDHVMDLVTTYKSSCSLALQQRCYEFLMLAELNDDTNTLMSRVLPVDGCCEDLEADESLSFLNAIVQKARDEGARDYVSGKLDEVIGVVEEPQWNSAAAYVNPTDHKEIIEQKPPNESEVELQVVGGDVWGKKNLDDPAEEDAQDLPDIPQEEEPTLNSPNSGIFGPDSEGAKKGKKKVKKKVAKATSKEDKMFSALFEPTKKTKKKTKKAGDAPLLSLLAAGELSAGEFQEQWGAHPHVGNIQIPLPAGVQLNIESMTQLAHRLGISTVHIIGQEFIAATHHVVGGLVLCHFTLDASAFNVKLCSGDSNVTAETLQFIGQRIFAA